MSEEYNQDLCQMTDWLTYGLESKSITKAELEKLVEEDPALVPILVRGLSSPKAQVRYGCAKALADLSAKHPEWLCPHWEVFAGLLGGKHRILTWNAIIIIANLSAVEGAGRFEAIFDRYYALLGDGYMVTAANVVKGSAKIARKKPVLADRIAERLLSVEKIATGPHMTEECRRVVVEQAVEALGSFYGLLSPGMREKATAFVMRQRASSRVTLAKAAAEFLESKEWL
jgi:hypothetical protein